MTDLPTTRGWNNTLCVDLMPWTEADAARVRELCKTVNGLWIERFRHRLPRTRLDVHEDDWVAIARQMNADRIEALREWEC